MVEAVEERDRNLGRFTSRLLEALQGAADRQDGNGDGIVSWREVVGYVERMVTADSIGDEFQQYPTAGPSELLDIADFPLTVASPESRVGYDSPALPGPVLTWPGTRRTRYARETHADRVLGGSPRRADQSQ